MAPVSGAKGTLYALPGRCKAATSPSNRRKNAPLPVCWEWGGARAATSARRAHSAIGFGTAEALRPPIVWPQRLPVIVVESLANSGYCSRRPHHFNGHYGANATWLLIASKAFLASSWVDLTCPYQTLPPTFDWLAA